MKGVILGLAPRVAIVDITHEIAPFHIDEAAFIIAEAYRWFRKGSIHVVIVDPGVGTTRRPILVESNGHLFIGPDNGVFSFLYDSGPHKVRAITNPALALKKISRTFHGRDVFAPAAAHLAKGVAPGRFGKLVDDAIRSASLKPTPATKHRWAGTILHVDRFGNLITNFHMSDFAELRTRPFEILAGNQIVRRLALTYAEAGIGELVAIEGSSGFLEISADQVSAAHKLGCHAGSPVELEIFY